MAAIASFGAEFTATTSAATSHTWSLKSEHLDIFVDAADARIALLPDTATTDSPLFKAADSQPVVDLTGMHSTGISVFSSQTGATVRVAVFGRAISS